MRAFNNIQPLLFLAMLVACAGGGFPTEPKGADELRPTATFSTGVEMAGVEVLAPGALRPGESAVAATRIDYSNGRSVSSRASARWETLTPTIASVSAGKVTGVAPGVATIRACMSDICDTTTVIIVSRTGESSLRLDIDHFIGARRAGPFEGDDRGFSTDPTASSRVSISVDFAEKRITSSVSESCLALVGACRPPLESNVANATFINDRCVLIDISARNSWTGFAGPAIEFNGVVCWTEDEQLWLNGRWFRFPSLQITAEQDGTVVPVIQMQEGNLLCLQKCAVRADTLVPLPRSQKWQRQQHP